jgi:hypothetical protein
MVERHVTVEALRGKVIDCHAHVGLNLKSYVCREYPYGQTVEELYYKQRVCGVDVNVVFPASGSLYFDPVGLQEGEMRPAEQPLSPAPYALENEMMMLEVFEFCPEHKQRFLPFVMADPARDVAGQVRHLRELEQRYPIYGIKISAVDCQSKITSLLDAGRALLDFAAERDLPFLLHTTLDPGEDYSRAPLCFEVIEKNPHLRFCLAHSIGYHAGWLQKANDMPNVWVDTAALTITVQLNRENHAVASREEDRLKADFSDHTKVFRALLERYPDTILWGTDSPWYAFVCRRKQGEGTYRTFRLKAVYEDEKAALDALPEALRRKACNTNTLRFLFDTQPQKKEDT